MSNRMADAIIGATAALAILASFIVLVYAVVTSDAGTVTEIGLLK